MIPSNFCDVFSTMEQPDKVMPSGEMFEEALLGCLKTIKEVFSGFAVSLFDAINDSMFSPSTLSFLITFSTETSTTDAEISSAKPVMILWKVHSSMSANSMMKKIADRQEPCGEPICRNMHKSLNCIFQNFQ